LNQWDTSFPIRARGLMLRLAGNDYRLPFFHPPRAFEPRYPLIHIGFEIRNGTETIHTHAPYEVADPLSGLIGYGLQVRHEWRYPGTIVSPGEYSRKDIHSCRKPETFVAAVLPVTP